MKFRVLSALACASAFCFAASAAQADVTFIGYQTAPNAGETLVTDFEGGPTLGDVTFLLPGYTLSGDGLLFTGSVYGVSAAPATSATTKDTTQYLTLQRGDMVTLDTPLLKSISFYIGSLDRFNSFTFHLADGTTEVVTGAILAALPGMDANGSQTGFTSNGRLTFTFDSSIDGIDFASGGNSLEIGDIAAVSAVPEPAAWAMMILGFGGVGGLVRKRRVWLAPA
ncbi:PEPxxWA-CTERM sorting domain-containing protein [Phenylobacterium sp.]|uniref:PEPxxWA-CTERM sorting domain-containing protein n=1 Tax=Phenylobacterium sp. TaxID=1871053 RepID=UPI0025D25EB0|nr:PEPxxWA-CTERM sorting domain-containing protein [Phenylobacterium sp.]